MPTDEEQYWEQEYAEFEEAFGDCKNGAFWRAPVHTLRETQLFSIFERFCELFPDHPSDHNTVFYLFAHVGVSPQMRSIVFRCNHFEHASLDDLRSLVEFLDFATGIISTGSSPHLDLLDGCAETLHVRFYSPCDEIVRLLQSKASRTTAV